MTTAALGTTDLVLSECFRTLLEVDLNHSDISGSDAVYSGGLAESAGPEGGELLFCLGPQMRDVAVIEVGGDLFVIKAPHTHGQALLLGQIALILSIDYYSFKDIAGQPHIPDLGIFVQRSSHSIARLAKLLPQACALRALVGEITLEAADVIELFLKSRPSFFADKANRFADLR